MYILHILHWLLARSSSSRSEPNCHLLQWRLNSLSISFNRIIQIHGFRTKKRTPYRGQQRHTCLKTWWLVEEYRCTRVMDLTHSCKKSLTTLWFSFYGNINWNSKPKLGFFVILISWRGMKCSYVWGETKLFWMSKASVIGKWSSNFAFWWKKEKVDLSMFDHTII